MKIQFPDHTLGAEHQGRLRLAPSWEDLIDVLCEARGVPADEVVVGIDVKKTGLFVYTLDKKEEKP